MGCRCRILLLQSILCLVSCFAQLHLTQFLSCHTAYLPLFVSELHKHDVWSDFVSLMHSCLLFLGAVICVLCRQAIIEEWKQEFSCGGLPAVADHISDSVARSMLPIKHLLEQFPHCFIASGYVQHFHPFMQAFSSALLSLICCIVGICHVLLLVVGFYRPCSLA